MKKIILLSHLLLSSFLLLAQPVNDTCTTATDLGSLPTPGACTGPIQNGLPVIASIGTTTIGATLPVSFMSIASCSSGPQRDVWFKFTATGSTVNINITPGAAPFLANPVIDLYKGTCGSLLPVGCAAGNASGTLSKSFYEIIIGQTYYLQVMSTSPASTGNFQLAVDNDIDCGTCSRTSLVTATPAPVMGEYTGGTVVNFCYNISQWVEVNTNWLHGVQVSWGSGWINAPGVPGSFTSASSCAGNGNWNWYSGCTASGSGASFPAGFYYDYTAAPGNPGNNFGDQCPTANWNFCFSLTAAPGFHPASDLSVTINTTGDGESGSWVNAGCAGDHPNVLLAQGASGTLMSASITQTSGTNPTCAGSLTTYTATTTNGGATPVYQWKVNGLNVGTNSPSYSTSLLINDDSVKCVVTSSLGGVTNSPFTSNSIGMTVNSLPTAVITPGGPTSFCSGNSVTLTSSAATSYLWGSGATTPSIIVSISGNDSVRVTDINGCSKTSAFTTVTVHSLPPTPIITAGGPTTFCTGDSVILTATSSVSYLWSTGETTQNIIASASENDLVTITDANGCSATSGTLMVTVLTNCNVWPGDANNDSVANNFDLLPIGLFYSQMGTARASVSNLWQSYPVIDWGTPQTNGSDIKHADCNGDGVIDNADTLAIYLNFSLVHAFAPSVDNARLTVSDLYFVTASSAYNTGDIVDVEIWAGSSTLPVSNLYGVAFNINYDVSLVQPGTESLTYPSSWLGTPGTNAITIAKIDAFTSTAYGGITRIDHNNAGGFGKIADFKFQAKTSISAISIFNLAISDYIANNDIGTLQVFNTPQDSITIIPLSTGFALGTNDSGFTIYPNPFTEQTTIAFNEVQKNSTIKIMDVLGKEIKAIVFSGKELLIEKGEMLAGVYFVQVIDENKNVVNKKIILQ